MAHDSLPISIVLPAGFLEPEVRCGYRVSAEMKKVWAIELDLLAKFDSVCRKHCIKYVALWGTALGAVRHQGFIPWDDDVDVGMDRQNYEKLCAVAEEEFTYPYFFQNPLTDRAYFVPLARLRNSKTRAVITGYNPEIYNSGIYIDIDILDGSAPNKICWRWQNFLKHLILVPLQMYYAEKRCTKSCMVSKILNVLWHRVSYESWCSLYSKIRSMYSRRSDRLGITYTFLAEEWGRWLTRDDVAEAVESKFEFLEVPICRRADAYLQRCYGDYMAYPPEGQRGRFHEGVISFEKDPVVV